MVLKIPLIGATHHSGFCVGLPIFVASLRFSV
jgi:hypothetical protein